MLQSLRSAFETAYGISDVWSGIGYVWLTLAVLLGGTIAWFLFIWFLRYVFVRRESSEDMVAIDVDGRRKVFERKQTRSCGNITFIVLQTLLAAGVIAIVWVAFASAGFNVWTTSASSLCLGLIGTYGFMTPISLWFNGYTATLARSVVVGEHVEFHGMGDEWSGRVVAIYSLSIDIVRWDEKSNSDEMISMPISRFLDQPRKRNFAKENNLKAIYEYPKKLVQVDFTNRNMKRRHTMAPISEDV